MEWGNVMYPEELIEKVATALYESQNSNLESREAYFAAEAVTVLDALGFAPYGGPKYWRSAIHVEED